VLENILTKKRSEGMNRSFWFATVLMISLLFSFFAIQKADAAFFYQEEMKDGRIYVFADMKIYADWKQTGELEKSVTRIGAGPNGETIVADSDDALQLYYFKHNLPGEVIVKAPEPPPPAMQEKLPYKFSGYMFGDYFYNTSRDPLFATATPPPNVALGGPEDLNGFLFRRIYLTFDDDISPDFTARFRLEADSASLDSRGKITVFVKDAYLRWKQALGRSDIWFGIHPTPAYEVSESLWAYRSLEKTIMDLRGIVSSRDIGASLRGPIDSGGKFSYWVMFGNGSGNNPETDKFKRLYGQFEWKPNDHFTATFYQDLRALPDITNPNNTAQTLSNDSYTTAWFVDYGTKDKYNIGYEGFFTRQNNGFTTGTAPAVVIDDKKTIGHSVWAWYNFNTKVGVVGRYDYFNPNNRDIAIGDKRDLFIGSLVLKPHKNVWIMPNIYWEGYEDIVGKSIKSSVTARLTLYYIFL
jgi:hypothetical protein